MSFLIRVALVGCFAVGAFGQATNSGNFSVKPTKCSVACDTTHRAELAVCRSTASSCRHDVFIEMTDILRPRYTACSSQTDQAARSSCRLAAIGFAISHTADQRAACATAERECDAAADSRVETCKDMCRSPDPNQKP